MLEQMAVNADNINKVLSTFKVSMFIGIVVNIIIISVLFRLTDMFINKLKEKFINPDNSATLSHIFPILQKVIKILIFFFITASFCKVKVTR